jgi:broad specificity phosphatase PhoE
MVEDPEEDESNPFVAGMVAGLLLASADLSPESRRQVEELTAELRGHWERYLRGDTIYSSELDSAIERVPLTRHLVLRALGISPFGALRGSPSKVRQKRPWQYANWFDDLPHDETPSAGERRGTIQQGRKPQDHERMR